MQSSKTSWATHRGTASELSIKRASLQLIAIQKTQSTFRLVVKQENLQTLCCLRYKEVTVNPALPPGGPMEWDNFNPSDCI